MLEVDGQSGANLGISLMAANTSTPSLVRSAWVGEDFVRTFAAHGVNNRAVAVVNAFGHNYNYDVTATCVSPQIDILEPRQTNFALVGEPASPIAFLARVRVTGGGAPVRGLVESSFSFDADGDAVTVVANSLQEIGGGEYWATLLPPTKPAGTTFVDFKACLDGTICDTETNALLYVAPGNSDIIILHDESGSMSTEDVVGEGTRLENAQKAAAVWANLAQNGDRYGVMGFNAKNNPVGCGLPGGDGNCELDIRTHMARTEITNPTSQIPTIEDAINLTDALEWTPIGAGLRAAKNALQASPYSLNPKYIILLSDGEENVNPLYGDPTSGIQQEMIDSGVVVHTIGFSGDSPSALLGQIAADTGGIFRYVPTSPGDSMAQAAVSMTAADVAGLLIAQGAGSTEMPPTGVFTYPLANDTPYTVTLRGFTEDGEGAPTEPQVVTPKEDPDPPSGFIQINGGVPQTFSRNVVLHVNVSDELLDGLPSPGSAASIANDYNRNNLVSAGEQMRFTNNTGAGWSPWEPFAPEKPWMLDPECAPGTSCVVYAQFKDAAENESLVVYDEIFFQPARIYLPLVLRASSPTR